MRCRLVLKLTARAAALSALVLLAGTACGGRGNSSEGAANGGTGANDTGGASQSGGSSAGTSGRANIAGDSATGGTPSFGGSSETGGNSNGAASGVGGSSAGNSGRGGEGGASPLPAAECGNAGGVCLSKGTCATTGGKVTADPGGCHFDDGPAECCVPPLPNPGGKTCADLGGICTPIGGCLSADGHFAAEDSCTDPGQACCVPFAACGPETIKCCEGGTTFRPACDQNGKVVCVVGQPHDLNFNCGP